MSVFSLLLVEVALRIYNPIPLPLRANEIVLPVRTHFVHRNEANAKTDPIVHVTYNGIGFRGPDKPADFEQQVTLLTIGGSTTACVGLSDGNTWPDRMAARMQEAIPNLWLNNAGFDGHSTFGHLKLLRQIVAELKPDVVIYLVGVNDVGRTDLNAYDAKMNVDEQSLRNKIVAHSELLSTIQVLSRTIRAIELGVNHAPDTDFTAIERIEVSTEATVAEVERHRQAFVPGYRDRLTELLTETREAGINPILVTQPALYGEGVDPTTGIELGDREYLDGVDSKTQWRLLELYNQVTRDVGAAASAPVIDLAARMPKDSRYYVDWMHYSNEGAERVAEIVAEALLPLVQEIVAGSGG